MGRFCGASHRNSGKDSEAGHTHTHTHPETQPCVCVSLISQKRKEEPSQTPADGAEQKSSDDGAGGEQKQEDSGVSEAAVEAEVEKAAVVEPVVVEEVRPVKRARTTNPYGAWEQIQIQPDP